jgi:hypothetical protein
MPCQSSVAVRFGIAENWGYVPYTGLKGGVPIEMSNRKARTDVKMH